MKTLLQNPLQFLQQYVRDHWVQKDDYLRYEAKYWRLLDEALLNPNSEVLLQMDMCPLLSWIEHWFTVSKEGFKSLRGGGHAAFLEFVWAWGCSKSRTMPKQPKNAKATAMSMSTK